MDTIQFLILALAVWRVSSLLAREEGPGRVFDHIRHLVGVRYEEGEVIFLNHLAKGVSCIACSSVYFGAVASAFITLHNSSTVWHGVALALALSASAIILDEIATRLAT
jgi:hypothetical protein